MVAGGYLFISCQPFSGTSEANFHLILDYVTHSVLKKSDVGGGNIFISPDSRFVVILERNGSIISVYKLTADGKSILPHLSSFNVIECKLFIVFLFCLLQGV